MSDINKNSRLIIVGNNPSCDLEGEGVVLDLASKQYFGLNEVALRIWQLLENEISLSRVVEVIVEEFEVDEARCLEDCQSFITELVSRGLVKVVCA